MSLITVLERASRKIILRTQREKYIVFILSRDLKHTWACGFIACRVYGFINVCNIKIFIYAYITLKTLSC